MQLDAMHRGSDALPELDFMRPDDDPFGRSTAQAMLHGVYHGIRGTVRQLVELYALRYGAYPMVIATGGDAETLFADEELIDRIVPNLTLVGITTTARPADSANSWTKGSTSSGSHNRAPTRLRRAISTTATAKPPSDTSWAAVIIPSRDAATRISPSTFSR